MRALKVRPLKAGELTLPGYGVCPECDRVVMVTPYGFLRKHYGRKPRLRVFSLVDWPEPDPCESTAKGVES